MRQGPLRWIRRLLGIDHLSTDSRPAVAPRRLSSVTEVFGVVVVGFLDLNSSDFAILRTIEQLTSERFSLTESNPVTAILGFECGEHLSVVAFGFGFSHEIASKRRQNRYADLGVALVPHRGWVVGSIGVVRTLVGVLNSGCLAVISGSMDH